MIRLVFSGVIVLMYSYIATFGPDHCLWNLIKGKKADTEVLLERFYNAFYIEKWCFFFVLPQYCPGPHKILVIRVLIGQKFSRLKTELSR